MVPLDTADGVLLGHRDSAAGAAVIIAIVFSSLERARRLGEVPQVVGVVVP